MAAESKGRITISLDKEDYEKVSELADRMGVSESKMASMLVSAGIEDNEWIIKMVTSSFAKKLKNAVGSLRATRAKSDKKKA